jgi:hypothetical protein
MTSTPQSPQSLPVATEAAADLTEDRVREGATTDSGPTVGASDAEADAARSGADDADLAGSTRDSDGTPVGEADREADERASGAE